MAEAATAAAPTGLGPEAVGLLQQLIRFNTVNPPGNEREAQELLLGMLTEAGWECELLAAEPQRPNLVARLRGETDGPTLALICHVDTVPADCRGVDAGTRGRATSRATTSGAAARST